MRSSRSLVAFFPWPTTSRALIHTSCFVCQARKHSTSTTSAPKTDEYGLPVRRSLPKLTRHVPSTPLKRRTRSTDALKPTTVGTNSPTVEADEDEFKDPQAMTRLEESIRIDRARYPDAILLTQVGSFFESYFDQAPLVAKLLGIKLTSKVFGKKNNKVRHAFAGFPLAQLAKHASTLVEAGHKVVVVEENKEVGDAASTSTSRRVTRVITPGTGIDEAFVKLDQIAFVLAIGLGDSGKIGMAYRDVSTGSSFTRISTLESLRDDLLLVQPKEVVVDSDIASSPFGQSVLDVLEGEQRREALMLSTISTSAIPPSSSTSAESHAENVLLAYLAETLVSTPAPPTQPTRVDPSTTLQMDSTTLKSLEIRESLRGGIKGSLLQAVRRTSTPSGARLLVERLCAPSTELDVINSRLSLVSTFVDLPSTRRYIAALLKSFDDLPRILQRLYLRRQSSPFDLLGLKKVILGVQDVRTILLDHLDTSGDVNEPEAVRVLVDKLNDHAALAEAIERAIDEEALHERHEQALRKAELVENFGTSAVDKMMQQEDGAAASAENGAGKEREGLWGRDEPWAIRPGFSPALQKLHERLSTLRRSADDLRQRLINTYELGPTAAKSLSLKVLPKYGPIVHILSSKLTPLDSSTSGFSLLVKSGSTRSYACSEWTAIHVKILRAIAEIQKLETETVKVLIARVVERYDALQRTAEAIAELDVALGFAEVASEMKWTRPEVNESTSLSIIEGRHPTVEQALQAQNRAFTTNSVHFEHPSAFIHVLTGPNMAGKSTFLRQTALIVLLSQVGSFVPASSARIGLVDRIFSRVGARDELDRDRSTFMIEMDEASSILHNATQRSLVLLDELGRGTSPLDGLAIAFAALEHLAKVNKSRTLFATHYHRLGELLGYDPEQDEEEGEARGEWEGVEFWCTDLDESEESVAYLHQVRRGLNDDSGGLTVARLSGMPERVIRTAVELRDRYR